MNDWNSWLNSSETRAAIKILNEAVEELKESVTNGSHIQEKDTNKIALDFTYSLGQIDGIREAIEMIKDISSILEEEEKESGN